MARLEQIEVTIEFDFEKFRKEVLDKAKELFGDTVDLTSYDDVVDSMDKFAKAAEIFGLTDGEEKAAEILTTKKLVLNHFPIESFYIPVYNKLDIAGTKVREEQIFAFIEKFSDVESEIQVTGISAETEYDRRNMGKAIITTLNEFIIPNIAPTYGALILQPPNLDGKLSLAYADEFMYISFNQNMEEFTLEAVNADMILLQPEQQQNNFRIYVAEVLPDGAYLEYLSVNFYNLIGSFKNISNKIGKVFYRNIINSILNEWRE